MSKYKFINEGKAHTHTLDTGTGPQPLYGTSTVVGILNKPLAYWAAGMAVGTLGWTATKSDPAMRLEVATVAFEIIKKLDPKAWLKRLDLAYKAHNEKKKDSAEAGTDMHECLETYVKLMISDHGGVPKIPIDAPHEAVGRFAKWASLNIEKFIFTEGHCFSAKHWVGGICDVGAIMKDGKFALLDFKSSKEAYYSQLVQIAGYAVQVEESGVFTANGDRLMEPRTVDELIVVPFGSDTIQTRSAQNIAAFKEAFVGALVNYKLSKAFSDN